jgi:RNA polymerase sigma-70 factor, ECF subfamily
VRYQTAPRPAKGEYTGNPSGARRVLEDGMQHALALPLPRAARLAPYHEPVQIGSDEALARRAARGDERAFEELVVRHQDKLYTLALRVTLSEADAYDCVQEGLIAAWRALPRFRGDARFSTWMYRIVVRKAYDSIERRRRTPEPVEELQAVAPEAQPEARLDLIAALGGLDPDFRVVAVACDILGMSMEDAGTMLELPTGTVKSRLHRARQQLAKTLEPDRTG